MSETGVEPGESGSDPVPEQLLLEEVAQGRATARSQELIGVDELEQLRHSACRTGVKRRIGKARDPG